MIFEKYSLAITYILAFLILVMWASLAYLTMDSIVKEQRKYAKLINISGQQRMLSQKTALYSSHLILEDHSKASSSEKIDIDSLQELINIMKNNHIFIMDNLSSIELKDLYLGDNNLNSKVNNYLKLLNEFTISLSIEDLHILIDQSEILLKKLNEAVLAFEKESSENVNSLKQRELFILLGTIITLILEAYFIIEPMVNFLKKHNEKLDDEVKKRTKSMMIFNKIFENAREGIVITDDEEKIINVNKAFRSITGYYKKDVIGKTPRILQSGKQPLGFYQKMWKNIEEDGIWQGEIINKGKLGNDIYEELTIMKLIDKENGDVNYVSIFSDITQRVKLINTLKYQKEQIQHYLDIAEVLILLLDDKKNVLMINQAGADLLGYTKEEIIGKNWVNNFLPKRLISSVDEVGDKLLNKKNNSSVYENEVLTKDGKERTLLWKNTTLHDEQGNVIGILTSGTDLTDERERQRQLLFHTKQAQMGEMLSMIAHQWRQPLASIAATIISIKINAELNNNDTSDYYEELENIEDITQHLSKTINDFREFFHDDTEKSITKLEDVVDSSLGIVKPIFKAMGIEVVLDYQCNDEFLTYPSELKQVVLNLLKNIQDIVESKKIENAKLEIRTYKKENKLYLEIQDNAGGIPDDIVDMIFEAYFTTKGELNGTGLGLYMSKKIIEEHCNGNITVKNKDNGACFIVEINS